MGHADRQADSLQAARLRLRAVTICIITTAVAAALEIGLGLGFGLISLVTEGLHTSADLLDSLIVLALVLLAMRPPDAGHPYGYGKYDALGGIIEGLLVGGSGVWAIIAGVRALLGYDQMEPRPAPMIIGVMAGLSVMYWFVSGYVLRIAKQSSSPAVLAEGVHLRTHVYITASLGLGLLLSKAAAFWNWGWAGRVDPLMAIGLGVVLIGLAGHVLTSGYRQIMDRALPEEERQKIHDTLAEFAREFIEIHAIRTRGAGVDRHVDIHLVVDPNATVADAHELAHRIEDRLVDALPNTRLLVHMEPADAALLQRYHEHGNRGTVDGEHPTPDAKHQAGHARHSRSG